MTARGDPFESLIKADDWLGVHELAREITLSDAAFEYLTRKPRAGRPKDSPEKAKRDSQRVAVRQLARALCARGYSIAESAAICAEHSPLPFNVCFDVASGKRLHINELAKERPDPPRLAQILEGYPEK